MSQEKQTIIKDDGGFFHDIGSRIKLIIRLIADPRVNIFLKLLPIASIIYLIIPSPIPPDLIPLPLDDALFVWLATYLFVELCPPDVVQEHMRALNMEIPGKWSDKDTTKATEVEEDDIIDAEYWEES